MEPWDSRRHQIPQPSIQRSHSGLTLLICNRFSCRSATRSLWKKTKHGCIPDTFPFSCHNDPSCQGPIWTSASSEGVTGSCGLAQTLILEWMNKCQPFRIVKGIADPYLGSGVKSPHLREIPGGQEEKLKQKQGMKAYCGSSPMNLQICTWSVFVSNWNIVIKIKDLNSVTSKKK